MLDRARLSHGLSMPASVGRGDQDAQVFGRTVRAIGAEQQFGQLQMQSMLDDGRLRMPDHVGQKIGGRFGFQIRRCHFDRIQGGFIRFGNRFVSPLFEFQFGGAKFKLFTAKFKFMHLALVHLTLVHLTLTPFSLLHLTTAHFAFASFTVIHLATAHFAFASFTVIHLALTHRALASFTLTHFTLTHFRSAWFTPV
ncbi:hypothetical protein [Stieleria mannarensis]|uniref:hypothetical protein n=1 Tax=Stieleria mannarensis TaxID=2755585 RepID=UPI0016022C9A|nr:hypothetical protein [Rhodopirellula sp. JC639]